MTTNSTKALTPTQPHGAPHSRRRRFASRRMQKNIAFYLFIAPWLLGLIFLVLIPVLGGVGISFTNYDGLNIGNLKFLGFRNYTRIFTDEDALWSLQRVFVWTALNVPLWLCLSFILAYLLNQGIRARGFFRTMYYLPSVIPLVAVGWIGRLMLHPTLGLVNQTLDFVFPGVQINWLTEYAMISLTTIAVWTGLGAGIVIFLAGLQGIPVSLYDAALIDGANAWQRIRHVTIPLLTPTIFFNTVLGIIGALQTFAAAFVATEGGPGFATWFFSLHIWKQAFDYWNMGYAAALAWFFALIIIGLTIIQMWLSKRWVFYYGE